MNFDQFVNNVNVKKVLIIAVAIFVGMWGLREIVFWGFVRSFNTDYAKFITQFEQDQQRIHNIIDDGYQKQMKMWSETEKRDKEFDEKFNKQFQKDVDMVLKDKQIPQQ